MGRIGKVDFELALSKALDREAKLKDKNKIFKQLLKKAAEYLVTVPKRRYLTNELHKEINKVLKGK